MDKEYWEKYYASQGPGEQPSDFARFCAQKYQKEYGLIFDIGCGNGRDTLFFASQKIPCVGIDQSQVAIEQNEAKRKQLGLDTYFHNGDFSAFDYDQLSAGPCSIYSRFTLHAINYDEEARLFKHLVNAKKINHLFIEARSIQDDLYGQGEKVGEHEYVTTHYRRFIDPKSLKTLLEPVFTIEHFEQGLNFAKTSTENPHLIRVIAKRK